MSEEDGGVPPGAEGHGPSGADDDDDVVPVGGDDAFDDEELFSDEDSDDAEPEQLIREMGHHQLMVRGSKLRREPSQPR